MWKIYLTLINKKAELAKGMAYLVLLVGYPYLGRFLVAALTEQFNQYNRIYVCRLAFFALLTGSAAWTCIRFLRYIKEDWESLFLLGIRPLESLFLFFLTSIDILFLQLYFGIMLFQIQGVEGGFALAANVLYGLLICLAGILLGLKARTNSLAAVGAMLAAGLAFLLGTGRLSYHLFPGG